MKPQPRAPFGRDRHPAVGVAECVCLVSHLFAEELLARRLGEDGAQEKRDFPLVQIIHTRNHAAAPRYRSVASALRAEPCAVSSVQATANASSGAFIRPRKPVRSNPAAAKISRSTNASNVDPDAASMMRARSAYPGFE